MKLSDKRISPEEVLTHPRHQAAQRSLVALIEQLRACRNVRDGYEFQQVLLEHVLSVEADRNGFSRAVKRMADGKSPQADAPQPQSNGDLGLQETWQLELDVCERVARQFRCVGDALAWRVFGYERRYILALCRNESPGVMAGKAGLAAERERVDQAWRDDGRFAIMHDLTNCLRIGDLTVFGSGGPETIEVKSAVQRRRSMQNRRIKAVGQALRQSGALPGDDRRQRLFDLDVSFKTHLDLLHIGSVQAARNGIFAARVPGNRALVVADLHGCLARGWLDGSVGERVDRKFTAALRRAGIGAEREWNVHATSLDSVSRDPSRVPFAAYPLPPVACARLIGDISFFLVETSGPALAEALRAAGVNARWVRPPSTADLVRGEVVMEMTASESIPSPGTIAIELSRMLQMRPSELDHYLIELIEQDTWIEGIRYLLGRRDASRRPWPCYRDEFSVWR